MEKNKTEHPKKLVSGWRVIGSWILVIILTIWLVWRIMRAFADRQYSLPNMLEYFIPAIFLTDAINITMKYIREDRQRRDNSHVATDGRLPWESKKD